MYVCVCIYICVCVCVCLCIKPSRIKAVHFKASSSIDTRATRLKKCYREYYACSTEDTFLHDFLVFLKHSFRNYKKNREGMFSCY